MIDKFDSMDASGEEKRAHDQVGYTSGFTYVDILFYMP